VIEIPSRNGHRPLNTWENPFEEGETHSRLDTFRTWREYFDYLLWESPNVLKDAADLGYEWFGAGVEAQELFFNPVHKEKKLPIGDGSFVGIVPGFMGDKFFYFLPKNNLQKLNWDVEIYPVKYGRHIEPTERMIDPLVAYSKEKAEMSGRKIHLVGHSKGGHVVLAVAMLRTEELAESVDQIVLVDAPIPDKVNFQTGVGYLTAQAIFRGNDFRLTRFAEDEEGLGRIERKFRLTTIKVANGRIIAGLHVGSEENIFEVESTHPGALHKSSSLRLVHTRLARPISEDREAREKIMQFPINKAA